MSSSQLEPFKLVWTSLHHFKPFESRLKKKNCFLFCFFNRFVELLISFKRYKPVCQQSMFYQFPPGTHNYLHILTVHLDDICGRGTAWDTWNNLGRRWKVIDYILVSNISRVSETWCSRVCSINSLVIKSFAHWYSLSRIFETLPCLLS